MFYTVEHYPDPTAGEAMQRVKRKERSERMNAGKRFEADWRESIAKAENVWYYRFRDSPATYYGGAQEGIRFAADNICDCLVYAYPRLYLFELKTVETPSASLTSLFGEFDPEKRLYKKEKHLLEMAQVARCPGVDASVVINFRATGHTYACAAGKVLRLLDDARAGGRKSILEAWCKTHGVEVAGRKLKVNWRYDVMGLLEALKEKTNENYQDCARP